MCRLLFTKFLFVFVRNSAWRHVIVVSVTARWADMVLEDKEACLECVDFSQIVGDTKVET